MDRNRITIKQGFANVGYMIVQDVKGEIYRHDPNRPIPEGLVAIIPEMFAGLKRTDIAFPDRCDYCNKIIESAHASKKSHVGVSFCSSGCVSDWEAHVD